MDWVKLYTQTFRHPKVAGLPTATQLVFVASITHAGDTESDGFIPKAVAGLMCSVRVTPKIARELVDAGLWEPVEGGWRLPNYLKYQKSAAEIETDRESRRKGGALGAHERFHVKLGKPNPDCKYCVKDGLTHSSSDSSTHRSPIAEESRGEKNSSSVLQPVPEVPPESDEDPRIEAVLRALAESKSTVGKPKGPAWFAKTITNDRPVYGQRIATLLDAYPTAPMDAMVGRLLGQPNSLNSHQKKSA